MNWSRSRQVNDVPSCEINCTISPDEGVANQDKWHLRCSNIKDDNSDEVTVDFMCKFCCLFMGFEYCIKE